VGSDTATLLWKNIEAAGICPGTRSLDEWLGVRWGRMRVGRWLVPVIPLWGLRDALIVHDVHHVLTGHDTSYRGEARLAVWELASGGCRWNAFFWLDRLFFAVLGLILCPRSLPRSFADGRRARNLYGSRPTDLLAEPIDELEQRVRR